MSPLRDRMIEDMTLAGLALGTRQAYTEAVRRLAARYRCSPNQLSEEEVRGYLLELRQQGTARGTFKISLDGLRFFYLMGIPGETEGPFLGADLRSGPPGAQAGSRRLRAAGVDALTLPSTRRRWTSRWTGRISLRRPAVRGDLSGPGSGRQSPDRRGAVRCRRSR